MAQEIKQIYHPEPLRSRPYIGPGNNDVQVFKLPLVANQKFLDVLVNLGRSAETLFYSSFSGVLPMAQLAFSFQPNGIQVVSPGPNPPSGQLFSLSQGVMWRFRPFNKIYLTGQCGVSSGVLSICFINGMRFHSESS